MTGQFISKYDKHQSFLNTGQGSDLKNRDKVIMPSKVLVKTQIVNFGFCHITYLPPQTISLSFAQK